MVWLCDSQQVVDPAVRIHLHSTAAVHVLTFHWHFLSSFTSLFAFYKRWLLLVNVSSQRKHSYPLLSFENRHADIDCLLKTSLSSLTFLRVSSSVPSWQVNKILEMMTDCCFEKSDWHFSPNTHQRCVTCVCGGECHIMLPSSPNILQKH